MTTPASELNFVKNDIIYVHGLFDESVSKNIIPFFHEIIKKEEKNKNGKIVIDIESDGGIAHYLHHLIALIEEAKKKSIIVETRVLGRAYSCGSLLACAGTKGHRFIGEFASHLCHLGFPGFTYSKNDIEIDRGFERQKFHLNSIRSIYKKYAKIPNLNNVLRDDNFFIYGHDIIKFGLADKFL